MKRYTMDWNYERALEDLKGEWVKYRDVLKENDKALWICPAHGYKRL